MIRVLVVDDEQVIREGTARVVAECIPDSDITVCATPSEALAEAGKKAFDIAFLDIEMPGMSGIELARKIREVSPFTNIIFSTAYPEYAGDAFSLHASGYITKPLNREKVMAEINDLRHPLDRDDKGLRARAFGNFEIFYDGKPLHFRYAKTKEMLAYLIDRNCAVVDIGEIRAILWDDDVDRTSYIKQLRKDLMDTLKEIGREDAIVIVRGGIGVVPGKISCDYFDFLEGEDDGTNAYHGEYMQQYSWSEVTHGSLESRVQND
jgi:two-component SAPR family response regulator